MINLHNIQVNNKCYTYQYRGNIVTIYDSDDVTIYSEHHTSSVSEILIKSIILDISGNDINKQVSTTLAFLINRLERIAEPIKWISIDADKVGCVVDGNAAISLANDVGYLRKIATDALNTLSLME